MKEEVDKEKADDRLAVKKSTHIRMNVYASKKNITIDEAINKLLDKEK